MFIMHVASLASSLKGERGEPGVKGQTLLILILLSNFDIIKEE